jgi:nucleotide-binding universal stress UspA family protein
MGETIVVGYDGQEHSERALESAIEIVRADDGNLIVVVVEEIPPAVQTSSGSLGSFDRPLDPLEPAIRFADEPPLPVVQEIIDRARDRLDAAGIAGLCEWDVGAPAQVIVDAATRHHASKILIGAHHHGFFERLFGEDVDADVQRAAPCEVVLVE